MKTWGQKEMEGGSGRRKEEISTKLRRETNKPSTRGIGEMIGIVPTEIDEKKISQRIQNSKIK